MMMMMTEINTTQSNFQINTTTHGVCMGAWVTPYAHLSHLIAENRVYFAKTNKLKITHTSYEFYAIKFHLQTHV